MAENAKIQTKKELSLYFWHLLLGAVVLAVCVPILNFLVSHKIAEVGSSPFKLDQGFLKDRTVVQGSLSFDPDSVDSLASLIHSRGSRLFATGAKESPKKTVSHETVAQGDIESSDNEKTRDSLQNGDKATVASHTCIRNEDKDDNGDNSSHRPDDAQNRDDEIRRLFDSRTPAPQIAKQFGISRQHVYKILKKAKEAIAVSPELKFA